MPATGTFTNYPMLVEPLPVLVRKQRTLAAKLATVAQTEKDEKAIRGQIDQLLVAAGLQKSELVTCAGYDVRHNERDGSSAINADVLTEKCVAHGIDRVWFVQQIAASTEQGPPSTFATVTPTKGAKVTQAREPATVTSKRIPGPHRVARDQRERQRA